MVDSGFPEKRHGQMRRKLRAGTDVRAASMGRKIIRDMECHVIFTPKHAKATTSSVFFLALLYDILLVDMTK